MTQKPLAIAIFVVFAGAALAQAPSTSGQPADKPPGTSGPTVSQDATGSISSSMTQEFLAKAAASGLFEIESSRLAADNAQDPAVKQFAQKMIKDHSDADAKLKAAASRERLAAPQAKLEADQQAALRDLKNAKGAEFDRKYIAEQQKAHAVAVKLFQTYAQSGDRPQITAFARETLPTLQAHKDMIDKMGQSRT